MQIDSLRRQPQVSSYDKSSTSSVCTGKVRPVPLGQVDRGDARLLRDPDDQHGGRLFPPTLLWLSQSGQPTTWYTSAFVQSPCATSSQYSHDAPS